MYQLKEKKNFSDCFQFLKCFSYNKYYEKYVPRKFNSRVIVHQIHQVKATVNLSPVHCSPACEVTMCTTVVSFACHNWWNFSTNWLSHVFLQHPSLVQICMAQKVLQIRDSRPKFFLLFFLVCLLSTSFWMQTRLDSHSFGMQTRLNSHNFGKKTPSHLLLPQSPKFWNYRCIPLCQPQVVSNNKQNINYRLKQNNISYSPQTSAVVTKIKIILIIKVPARGNGPHSGGKHHFLLVVLQ